VLRYHVKLDSSIHELEPLIMASASSTPKPIVGILSLGEMGTGIAQLLLANDYQVATCTTGRR
jgi:hypothetical protein